MECVKEGGEEQEILTFGKYCEDTTAVQNRKAAAQLSCQAHATSLITLYYRITGCLNVFLSTHLFLGNK